MKVKESVRGVKCTSCEKKIPKGGKYLVDELKGGMFPIKKTWCAKCVKKKWVEEFAKLENLKKEME